VTITIHQRTREKGEIDVILHTGQTVGSFSREYLIECEAKYLLAMPLKARREALKIRELKRGLTSVLRLKEFMKSIHDHRRLEAQQSWPNV
jgi:hypothetical protein